MRETFDVDSDAKILYNILQGRASNSVLDIPLAKERNKFTKTSPHEMATQHEKGNKFVQKESTQILGHKSLLEETFPSNSKAKLQSLTSLKRAGECPLNRFDYPVVLRADSSWGRNEFSGMEAEPFVSPLPVYRNPETPLKGNMFQYKEEERMDVSRNSPKVIYDTSYLRN